MSLEKVPSNPSYKLSRFLKIIRLSVENNSKINDEDFLLLNCLVEFEEVEYVYVKEEFEYILLSDYVDIILRKLQELNILKMIIPELSLCYKFNQKNKYHNKDVFEHIISVTSLVPKQIDLRMASILHDIGKPLCFSTDSRGVGHFRGHEKVSYSISNKILNKWGYDKKFINRVGILVLNHMRKYKNVSMKSVHKLEKEVGKENVRKLIILQIADNLSKNPKYVSTNYLIDMYKLSND